jgi:hypothetical protein
VSSVWNDGPAGERDRPTSAPREDQEADASSREPVRVLRAGWVEVGEGLRVLPMRPEGVGAEARNYLGAGLARPADVWAQMRFDGGGRVVAARLRGSTGFAGLDRALLSSFWGWRAEGEALESAGAEGLVLERRVVFGR